MCEYHKELLIQIKKSEIITEEYRTNMPNVLENYKSSFLKCEICKKLQLKGCEIIMVNLKELLNELFDNYPEAAQDYSLDIWDRYYLEFERKQLTNE